MISSNDLTLSKLNTMKNKKILIFLAFSLIFGPSQAQLTQASQFSELSISGFRARILNGGDLFNSFSSLSGFEIPKVHTSQVSRGTLAAAAIWIGAYDENNVLHTAVMVYRQKGVDYYPGPITTDSVNSTNYYDKIFEVNADDLLRQKQSGNTDISKNLQEWPTKDDIFFQNTRPLAPYFDKDKDNVYNPYVGDYPLINGQDAFYMIFNDNGLHGESGGLPLEVDVEAMCFGFASNDSAINNTMFVNYAITNRSKHTYKNFYIALWVDFDIGFYSDDMAGCDSARNLFFAYNGDNNDEGVSGYGFNPPAQGLVFLNHKMNSFHSYNNSTDTLNGNPNTPIEYYRLMSGFNLNGTAVRDHLNRKTRYAYYGHVGEQGAYNMLNAGEPPFDIRGIGSIGPYTLPPDESVCLDVAFITAFDDNQNIKDGMRVPTLQRYTDTIQKLYDINRSITKNILCMNKQVTEISSAAGPSAFQLYPNPNHGLMHIDGMAQQGQSEISIYSTDGKLVSTYTTQMHQLDIDISGLPAGLYHIIISNSIQTLNARIIKL